MEPPTTAPFPDDDFNRRMAPIWKKMMDDLAPVMESVLKDVDFNIPASLKGDIASQVFAPTSSPDPLKLGDLSKSAASNLNLSGINTPNTGLDKFLAAYQPKTDIYKSLAEQSGVNEAFRRLSESLAGSAVFSPDLTNFLAEKFKVYNPDNLWSATQLATSTPEIMEAVEQTVEENPAEVEELVTTATGKTPAQFREMSSSQVVKSIKEVTAALGAIFGATLSSPVIAVLAAIIVLSLAAVELELEIQEGRGGTDSEEQ